MEGAPETFARLYDEHVDAIFGYLARRLTNRERAKELTHDVFTRVWQHLRDGKSIEHERAFLFTIAKRLFINEIRAPEHSFSLDKLTDDGFDPVDTEARSSTFADATELWDFITTLPPATQELLRLRYYDDLPISDIARILDAKDTAISMRLQRALEALKKRYRLDPPA
jgi:RNA polymerase sigma-70 factor (ECF subfamily)